MFLGMREYYSQHNLCRVPNLLSWIVVQVVRTPSFKEFTIVDLFVFNIAIADFIFGLSTILSLAISNGDLHNSEFATQVALFGVMFGTVPSLALLFGLASSRYLIITKASFYDPEYVLLFAQLVFNIAIADFISGLFLNNIPRNKQWWVTFITREFVTPIAPFAFMFGTLILLLVWRPVDN